MKKLNHRRGRTHIGTGAVGQIERWGGRKIGAEIVEPSGAQSGVRLEAGGVENHDCRGIEDETGGKNANPSNCSEMEKFGEKKGFCLGKKKAKGRVLSTSIARDMWNLPLAGRVAYGFELTGLDLWIRSSIN